MRTNPELVARSKGLSIEMRHGRTAAQVTKGNPSKRRNKNNCVVTLRRTGAKATVRFLNNTTNTA